MAGDIAQICGEQDFAPIGNQIRGLRVAGLLKRFLHNSADCVHQLANQYGFESSVVAPTPLNLSKRKYVVAIGASNNQIVLGNKDAFRTTGYMFNGPPGSAISRIRSGLLQSRGKQHTSIRAMLQPIFARKSIAEPFDQFIRITREQADKWHPQRPLSLWEEMCVLTRRLSGRILLNNETDEVLDDLSQKIQRVIDHTFRKTNWFFPYDLPGTSFRKMLGAAEDVETTLLEMIRQRRTIPLLPEQQDVLGKFVNAKSEDGTQLTDSQIAGQMVFFFSASFETAATMLTWTLIALAQHPQVLQQLEQELEQVLAGASPTLESVNELPFLDRVIRESLRLYPPLPTLARVAIASVQLADGQPIQFGDRIVVSPYASHRNPAVFPQPLQFHPDRWLTATPSPWQYLPFGAGQRYCVAANYATVLLKVCLSVLLQRHRFRLVSRRQTIPAKTRIVLRPQGRVMVRPEPR